MNEPRWVLPDVVRLVHRLLLEEHGGSPGLRDSALLESVLHHPQQRFAYEPACSLFDLAAAYGHGLAKNHPFVDGNKRMALTIAALFLELNGHRLEAPEPETVATIEALATGELDERDFADWLARWSVES